MAEQRTAIEPELGGSGVQGGAAAAGGSGRAEEKLEAAKTAATDVAGNAKEAAANVTQEAGQQARAVAGEVSDQARQLIDTTRMELKDQAAARTERLAGTMRSLSDQVRALAEGRPEEAGQLRSLASDAQQRLTGLAQRLDQGGVDGVVADLGTFARRRPLMFLVGCAGAGFALGRVMRATRAAGGASSTPSGNGFPAPEPYVTAAAPMAGGTAIGGATPTVVGEP